MKLIKLTSILALLYGVGSAGLAVEALAAEAGGSETAAPLTRAEVLADLEIWRESGLAELSNGEEELACTPRHDAAMARYAALRADASFSARVQRIAAQRGERVLMAATR